MRDVDCILCGLFLLAWTAKRAAGPMQAAVCLRSSSKGRSFSLKPLGKGGSCGYTSLACGVCGVLLLGYASFCTRVESFEIHHLGVFYEVGVGGRLIDECNGVTDDERGRHDCVTWRRNSFH